MNRNKIIRFIFGIFLLIGFVLMTVAIGLKISDRKFFASAKNSKAKIIDFSLKTDMDGKVIHKAIIGYTIDGISYETELPYCSSSLNLGDKITIYYQKNDPIEIKIKSSSVSLVYATIGGVFILIGAIFFLPIIIRSRGKQAVKEKVH